MVHVAMAYVQPESKVDGVSLILEAVTGEHQVVQPLSPAFCTSRSILTNRVTHGQS